MKQALVFGMIFGIGILMGQGARAQTNSYRVYKGSLSISETKVPVSLKVNDRVIEERLGDPEIPGHGFIRRSLAVKIYEGKLSCESKLLLENGEMKTCSGLRFMIQNPDLILTEKTLIGAAYVSSSNRAVGQLEFVLDYTQDGDHEGSIDD